MADLEANELLQPQPYEVAPNIFEQQAQRDLELERDKSIANTPTGATLNTWFKNAGANSVAAPFGKWLGEKLYTDFKDQEGFIMDDEVALHVQQSYKIPPEYFGDIRGVKSDEELSFRVNMIQQELDFKKEVENQLTYDGAFSQASTSAFTGQILDDVTIGVLSGGVASIATRLTGLTRPAAMAVLADVSLETGLSAARYTTRDDYTAGDVFTDLTLGLAPSALVAYKTSGVFTKIRENGVDMTNQAVKASDDIATPKVDTDVKLKDTTVKGKDTNIVEPTVKKQESPDEFTYKQFTKPTARKVINNLRSVDPKSPVIQSVKSLKDLTKRLRRAKTTATKQALRTEINKIESTPEIQAVKQVTHMMDNPALTKQLAKDVQDLASQIDTKSADTIIAYAKKELGVETFKTIDEAIKTGKITSIPKGLDKKKLTKILGISMVFPVVAEASDDDIKDEIYLGAVMLALGAAGYQFVKASGGARQSLQRINKVWDGKANEAKYQASSEAGAIRKTAVKLSNVIDTELTNTKVLFAQNKEAMGLVDKMVGKGDTLDMDIRQMYESAMGDINRTMRDTFENWKVGNPNGTLDDFNKLASEYIDNADSIPKKDPNIVKMVDTFHEVMERMYEGARVSGAKGFEKIEYKKDMLPRLWKNEQMKDLLNRLEKGSDDYNAVVSNLKGAFKQSVADYRLSKSADDKDVFKNKTDDEVAETYTAKFVNLWTNSRLSNFTKKSANRDITKIREFLIKNKLVDEGDEMLDDLAESLIPASQISSRAKRRVTFDPKYLNDVTVKIDGESITVGKSSYVERDLMQIVDTTSKELAISTAYARKGFVSRSMLDDEIIKVSKGDDTQIDVLSDYKNLLEGRPTLSNSPFTESFITLSRASVSLLKLPLVAFSTLPEFMNVLARGGLVSGTSALTKSMFKAYPTNGEVIQLRNITGLASFNDRLYRKGYIGYDEVNDALNPNKALTKFAKTTEDWAYTINRLGWITDVVQLAGIEANLKTLRQYASTGKGFPVSRLEEYGITTKWMDEFGDVLRTGEELNMDKWSNAKKNRFGIVIKSLNQTISPETMLHTKGLWTSTNTFGRAVSSLLNYSATVFNEQGLPLLRHTDRHSTINNINAFVGAYIGLNLKYALEGKEVEQEDILTYAIAGSPIGGSLGMAKGILNPATLTTTADLFNMVAPDAIEVR